MSAAAAAAVKAAILALTDENTRKKIGWVLAAILSPVILLIAFLCALGSGTASHNLSVVELCFYGGTVPSETPDEYRAYIEEMRAGFNLLDGSIENINELTEGEDGLDEIRVKALFYALYFGADSPGQQDCRKFADCFVAYEERTRTVTVEHEDGTNTEEEETYTVAVPIKDLEAVYENLHAAMGVEITEDSGATRRASTASSATAIRGEAAASRGLMCRSSGRTASALLLGRTGGVWSPLSLATVLTLSRESGGVIPAWTWRSPQVHPSAPPCLEP